MQFACKPLKVKLNSNVSVFSRSVLLLEPFREGVQIYVTSVPAIVNTIIKIANIYFIMERTKELEALVTIALQHQEWSTNIQIFDKVKLLFAIKDVSEIDMCLNHLLTENKIEKMMSDNGQDLFKLGKPSSVTFHYGNPFQI